MDRQLHRGSNRRLMGRFRTSLAALLALVLVTTACGSPGAGEDENGPVFEGQQLLINSGQNFKTLDLGSRRTQTDPEQDGHDAVEVATADPINRRLYVSSTTFADPFTVEVYDRSDLAEPVSEFTWPDTGIAHTFAGLAVSPGGSLVAAVVTQAGPDELSVVSIENGNATELLSQRHFTGKIGSNLAWLDDETLVFELDVRDQPTDYAAAIVALNVTEAARTGELDLTPLVIFSDDEWSRLDTAIDFAVSPDGELLAYSYRADDTHHLWVKGLTESGSQPTRLTSGAQPHIGAAFSPDGTQLAFVNKMGGFQPAVLIIPSAVTATLDLDDHSVWHRHLVTYMDADRILAWY